MGATEPPLPSFTRRGFVSTLAFGSVASMVAGVRWGGTALASIRPHSVGDVGVLRLRLADFPALGGAFGSIRLGLVNLNQASPLRPIIVSQDAGQFFVVSSECTHAGCTIPAFSSGKISTCPCHGSRYRPDGSVQRGPATFPLDDYPVELEGESVLRIELPEIPAYDVTVTGVVLSTVARLALEFPTLRNVDYEVLGRAEAGAPWATARFATTEGGVADQVAFKGTGTTAKVFVDRTAESGLFAVSMKLKLLT